MKFKKTVLLLREDIDNSFKNKCDFFDIPPKDIITELIIKFTDGSLDEILHVPPIVSPNIKDYIQQKNSRIRRGTR